LSFLSQPLQDVFIKPKRMIDTIAVQVIVNEATTDTLTITKQPVQQGASIADHAFVNPVAFSHTIYFAAPSITDVGNTLASVYQKLIKLQKSLTTFSIITPKRTYKDMLMTSLGQTTDKLTENCLAIHASYEQVILVPISATTVPRINQRHPNLTAATANTGNKSAFATLAGK